MLAFAAECNVNGQHERFSLKQTTRAKAGGKAAMAGQGD
jgi:hypothetical protein